MIEPPRDYVTPPERVDHYDSRTAEMLAWIIGSCAGFMAGVMVTVLYLTI